MKKTVITAIIAAICLAPISRAFAALIWSPPTKIVGVLSMHDGSTQPQYYIKVPAEAIAGSCESATPTGKNERWFKACSEEEKVPAAQCTKWFAAASLAYATGKSVRIYYDNSNPPCKMKGIHVAESF